MLDLLKTRRSIRKYQDKKVEKEKIDAILKSALMAPSSSGRKLWEFIVVEDKEKLEKLSKCRERGSQLLAGAPLAIVVAIDGDPYDVWIEDASIAAIIMQLTAHSLGLGTCWVQVRERQYNEDIKSEEYIKQVLEIPESVKIECMIAIGYPDEEKVPHDEESLLFNKIHKEKF
ncbi:MAG: nitroreductase family protein [Lutispora sp.]|nr:nitroreductase family protein [Lutispora sp.]MDD4833786.1 nitroreductase family protein [Lutispora sp.]